MNLFVKSLDTYLKNAWDKTFNTTVDAPEARFIVQSMGANEVFELFESLEDHKLKQQQNGTIKSYFRVASRLWEDWCKEPGAEGALRKRMAELGAIGDDGQLLWIDQEDKLTWYRNRTIHDEQADGLIIILVGLNHATDQGGLADFHQVDEARLWREMDESFGSWLYELSSELALDASPSAVQCLDNALKQIFDLRPLQLAKLANFIDKKLVRGQNLYSFSDLIERLFWALPYWGIPPIGQLENSSSMVKKGANYIKAAEKFISHQAYKTKNSQDKVWGKIEKYLKDEEFVLPKSTIPQAEVSSLDEYKDLLKSFIYKASSSARLSLLQLDIMPLLIILDVKEVGSKKTTKTIKAYNGFSFESMLQGVKDTLVEFTNSSSVTLAGALRSIELTIERFEHDMVADEEQAVGSKELAKTLLERCLGGLPSLFNQLDCRIPCDENEANELRSDWSTEIPVTFNLDSENINYSSSRSTPSVHFRVTVSGHDNEHSITQGYRWLLPPTHPERVLAECARLVSLKWEQDPNPSHLLPSFQIAPDEFTALYYAADEEEANRLVSQAMTNLKIVNLLTELPAGSLEVDLDVAIFNFIDSYRNWLNNYRYKGFYSTIEADLGRMLGEYAKLIDKSLSKQFNGSDVLMRRLYKAFFIIDQGCKGSDVFMNAAVAWGLSPVVLEQLQAKCRFLANGFPEVLADLALGGDYQRTFNRLIELSAIQRPVTVLVRRDNQLCTEIKSYGLLHYIGTPASSDISLAVQTKLRESGIDDDDISEIMLPCQERVLVARVIEDYQQLYSFSHDGLRILAINVKDLQTILSGVDQFIENFLKDSPVHLQPFHITVMVYTSSSSPMVMENWLSQWRDLVQEKYLERGRGICLKVGHQFASKSNLEALLNNETRHYDIAFVFHFLKDGASGRAVRAQKFTYSYDNCSFFPIAEYPRPIGADDQGNRQSLISNRRLRAQTKHADMSVHLNFDGHETTDYVIFGKVNFEPWIKPLNALHRKAHWVACIDPFIDKRMLVGVNTVDIDDNRKIVGFSSGLGAYGELNMTISTQQDTLKQLSQIVFNRLVNLLPFVESKESLSNMSQLVVCEAEEVIGLSSLRAVVGTDERIREVIGFAAIKRALKVPAGQMSQLLPLDSFRHWFADSDTNMRPDLLQLTLQMRDGDIPLLHAHLLECKLARKNTSHVLKAKEQIEAGLKHLTRLFAPKCKGLHANEFDRRYWWAQLHRALSSRSEVRLSVQDWVSLDAALENLAEGLFEIHWHSTIFTFWTDDTTSEPVITSLLLAPETVSKPFTVDNDYTIRHVELGYLGLTALFANATCEPIIGFQEQKISIRAVKSNNAFDYVPAETVIPAMPVAPAETVIPVMSVVPAEPAMPVAPAETVIPAMPIVPAETEVPEVPVIPLPFPVPQIFIVPEKICIGKRPNKESVYWHFGHPQLANRHLLIFGASGSGKTYGIQCLLGELATQQVRSFIIDYTNGFLPSHVELAFKKVGAPKDYFVKTDKLPLNPLRRQQLVIDPSLPAVEESPFDVASRIASIFTSVYPTMGDQQGAALINVLKSGLESNPNFKLDDLLEPLRTESRQGESLANKIQQFIETRPFSDSENQAWAQMLSSPVNWVHILQLAALSRDVQKLITEFILWDLWDYVQNTGSKDRPIPIVLDEIQNLDHSSDSPIDKMLREGRKFGLSLILATQTISQFNKEQTDRLFQAGHKLFFKPATTEVESFAKILAQTTQVSKADWQARLSKLEKGQCWSLGPVEKSNGALVEEAVLVSVTALEMREFGV